MRHLPVLFIAVLAACDASLGAERDMRPVDLTGVAADFEFLRTWNSYYRGEDFTFRLRDETGKTWRIISREITPAYDWRMGPTYPELKVDWTAKPRVRVIGVEGMDRLPETFHNRKLDDAPLATAFVVSVETKPGTWAEYYVNNWFHKWGPAADRTMHALYADRKAPYDIYGWVVDMAAPFDARSQAILKQHPEDRLMYHGRIKSTKENPFGFEVELLQLIGRDPKTGGEKVLFGDASGFPKLDGRKLD